MGFHVSWFRVFMHFDSARPHRECGKLGLAGRYLKCTLRCLVLNFHRASRVGGPMSPIALRAYRPARGSEATISRTAEGEAGYLGLTVTDEMCSCGL